MSTGYFSFDGHTPDTTIELYQRYRSVSEHVREPVLDEYDEDYMSRFRDIEEDLHTLWHRDMAEWIEQRYRSEFQQWQRGEREEPPCTCGNPRCPLLQGQVPYQLRRRSTTLDREEQPPMEALKAYLKQHPDALVIDEALTDLRNLRSDVAARLNELFRELRGILEHEGKFDEVDLSGLIDDSPSSAASLSPPGGRQ